MLLRDALAASLLCSLEPQAAWAGKVQISTNDHSECENILYNEHVRSIIIRNLAKEFMENKLKAQHPGEP